MDSLQLVCKCHDLNTQDTAVPQNMKLETNFGRTKT